MRRREFLGRASGAALGLATCGLMRSAGAAPADRPNVVLILIDDLGWADVGCYGSTFHETPHIDRLATQGLRFTDAYAAPVCSPTRASILTGKYTASVGITDFIPGHYRPYAKLVVPKNDLFLSHDEDTIAAAMKRAGYRTACFGKWHLGWGKEHNPGKYGFEEFGGAPNKGDKAVAGLTARAEQFIQQHKDRPFFLFLSHHTVHIPLQAPQRLVRKYRERAAQSEKPQSHPTYAAMVEYMDWSVGRIMAKLDELKLADRTLLIFYSDNGGLRQRFDGKGEVVTSNAPLRDEKGSLYEGGIRVPLVVRWPGNVKAGTQTAEPVTCADLYPTFLDAVGAKAAPAHKPDGESLVSLLRGTGRPTRDAIYWHYPHYHHTAPCGAIRQGDLKLIEYFEDGALELYNLKDDIGETKNLAKAMPDQAAALRRKLSAWRKAVGARMPTPNANHDPARAHEWHRRPRPAPKK
ncbi:sulfatase [bacterium]|nr:sulfatase [bacterium]